MHDTQPLGPADVDDATLTAMVAEPARRRPGRRRPSTLGGRGVPLRPGLHHDGRPLRRERQGRRGRRAGAVRAVRQGRAVVVALAVLRRSCPRRSSEFAEASVPWRTEPLAYRSDLGRPAARRADHAARARRLRPRREVRLDLAGEGRRRPTAVGRRAATPGRRTSSAGSPPQPAGGAPGAGRSARLHHARLRLRPADNQVLPILHDDGDLAAPARRARPSATSCATGCGPRRTGCRRTSRRSCRSPTPTAHGDACPNNLLTAADPDDFTLIDFGFWQPMPVGADLEPAAHRRRPDRQAPRRRPRRPRRRPRGGVRAGPPRRGLRHPRARRPPLPRPPHADDERSLRPPRRAPRPPAVGRPRRPGRRPRRHRDVLPGPGSMLSCAS